MNGRKDGSRAIARRRARRRGQRAERLAALWLRLKGYRILARGFAVRGGEIDVIARRGRRLAFVEVKYRPDGADAAAAITATKRRRINHAARAWLMSNPADANLAARFDAILITPARLPRHIAGAWADEGNF